MADGIGFPCVCFPCIPFVAVYMLMYVLLCCRTISRRIFVHLRFVLLSHEIIMDWLQVALIIKCVSQWGISLAYVLIVSLSVTVWRGIWSFYYRSGEEFVTLICFFLSFTLSPPFQYIQSGQVKSKQTLLLPK